MAKIEKDQFEKYLEKNTPTEEPSPEVLNRLQKQAVWNQPPSTGKGIGFKFLIFCLVIILGMVIDHSGKNNYSGETVDKQIQAPVPVLEEVVPEPFDVIASKQVPENMGSYRFMKFKGNDFNLSFAEDSSSLTMLGISREIDNI